jgi:hypothetical protein
LKQFVLTLLVEFYEKPAKSALAGHSFIPAEYALDHFVVAKSSGMCQPCCPQNGSDHKPFSKINRIISTVGIKITLIMHLAHTIMIRIEEKIKLIEVLVKYSL